MAEHYDTYLPIGGDCTPAHYLRLQGLRREAYPLDWMVFGTDALMHLLQTGFSDFFASIAEEESIEANPCRYIRDTRNDVLSIHHFPKDREIDDALEEFRATMRRRSVRLDDRLTRGHSLLMLGCRDDADERVCRTLLDVAKLYPHLRMHLVNVCDAPDMDSSELRQERYDLSDRLRATCCHFNNSCDTHAQKPFGLWGNEALWRRVMAEL